MTTARHRLRWLGACWAGAILCAPAPCRGQEESAARLVPTPLAGGGPTFTAPRFDWQEIFDRRPLGGALRWSKTACAPTTAPGAWAMRADRRHQFLASGAYRLPSGLSLGLAACYRARATGAGLDSADAEEGYELSLTRGGAEGKRPAGYEAALQLDYPLSRRETKLNLLLDLNLLATDLDGRKAARVALLQPPPAALRLGLRVRF